MKLLSFRLTAAILAAVLGVTSLAIAADEAPETKTSEEGASAPADPAKKSLNKKPRGVLADSFLFAGGEKPAGKDGSTLPGVATGQRGILAPVVAAAAAEQVRNGGPRVEPVLNTPAPPIVEAPSPLAPPVAVSYNQPAPPTYYQTTSTPFIQPAGASYVQQAGAPFVQQASAPFAQQGSAPFVRTASWSMNGGPEVQADEPPPISSNVSCSCSDDGGYTSCGCCPNPLWCHRNNVFLDLLYLRPGNIDYVYAVAQTGPLATDVPTGQTGRVGFDGAPGYRLGGAMALCDCASIQASYTWYNVDTGSSISAAPGSVLIFQPGLPQIPNVGSTAITASGSSALRFQLLDIDYRSLLYGDCNTAVNYFAGVRYANLKQTFQAQEDVGVPVGLSTVNTAINFDGFGIGMGLDYMKRRSGTGFLAYGKSSVSFVSGEFKAQYREVTQFGPNSIIGNNITDYRVMSILTQELGLGWESCCGRVRLLAGYQFQSWNNALTTAPYIYGVQHRRFDNINETLTFDGFTSRVQFNW
ncbi:MAG TPA: Lpg1974 family pore-forming outer membrane protein [Pirellulaceae bacterium]|jgi:hypothetical protein